MPVSFTVEQDSAAEKLLKVANCILLEIVTRQTSLLQVFILVVNIYIYKYILHFVIALLRTLASFRRYAFHEKGGFIF